MSRRSQHPRIKRYKGPSGGYGSLKSVAEILVREHLPAKGGAVTSHQNKPDGFMGVTCAWGKPAKPHPAEFCEIGAKATAWEITERRVELEFFARHSLTELEACRTTISRKPVGRPSR